MQQLSNDTGTWSLIAAPLPAPLFYNSNTSDSNAHGGGSLLNDFNNPIVQTPLDPISSLTPRPVIVETNSANYWAFALIFFPVLTIFGNVLVVVSVYREKSLHTVTNYFVVSLAIADITVAAVVMPFAIYLEFNRVWELSARLCDFWVASDCMACTASILNLVAIAVDRYIAVTKPLKYARHKNPKRVSIMIVIVWLVSFFIALPIVSGVNKSDVGAYPRVPEQCAFFNNKFLIFSSLGSFFIPCVIIFAIYYRILMVIMARARKNRKQWRPKAVIEMAAAQHRTNANHLLSSLFRDRRSRQPSLGTEISLPDALAVNTVPPAPTPSFDTCTIVPNDPTPTVPVCSASNSPANDRNRLMLQLTTPALSAAVRASINAPSSSGDQIDDDERDDIALFLQQQQQQDQQHHQPNGNKEERKNPIEILSSSSTPLIKSVPNSSKSVDIVSFRMTTRGSQTDNHHHNPTKRLKTRLKGRSASDGIPMTALATPPNNAKAAKRKAHSHIKKERKATKTLIIVLICFLVCWLPFFVLNNLVNAIFKLSGAPNTYLISDFTLTICAWLGWINSFLNPIIYTIFNMEFRKAFTKILFSPCGFSTVSTT